MTLRYQIATTADYSLLMEFIEEFYELDHHVFDAQKVGKALSDLIAHPIYGRIWLICQGHIPIGYVALTFGYSLEYYGRDAILDEIYLRAPYRGQGIGTQTIGFVEHECRQLDINAVHLEVMTDNQKAYEVYRRLGYKTRESRFLHKVL